jgi:hypothetical protein
LRLDHRSVTPGRLRAGSITLMNLVQLGLEPVRRLMGRGATTTCFVCRTPILPSEERLRLRGDTLVHRRCATYRMRNRHSSGSRLGFRA